MSGCGGDGERSDGVVARARPGPASQSSSTPARGGVLVDVAGLVRAPGVYRLQAGARVHEAIEAAGGARPGADVSTINRAAPVIDGQQVLVGAQVASGAGGAATAASSGEQVSINTAAEGALEALPGIGPVTAARIVAERELGGPFASIDDLDRVNGIGPATIEFDS